MLQQFNIETVLQTFPQLKAFGLSSMGIFNGELVSVSNYDWQGTGYVSEQEIAQAFADGKIELI